MNIPAFCSASWGLQDAAKRFDAKAQSIAAGSPAPSDLATDLVEGTMLAPAAYTANATVLKVTAETHKSLIDIRA